jgi:hypothetical protein
MSRLLAIVLVMTVFGCHAQVVTGNIRGVVVDKQSQSPLPGVVIHITGSTTPQVVLSDVAGIFKLKDVPVGRWQLKFQLLGYKERYIDVVLIAAKESFLNVELEESVIIGNEVIVKAEQDKTKSNNKMNSVSARIFSSEEAARYAGSRNDPARMAANFAGVSGANDSRNDIIIRGNSPMGLLWRLNGLDIPNPNHFGNAGSTGGPISILNNNTLDNSDFITGAFSSDYGNATAGVFDLKMRKGNNERYEFLGQLGFNGFEFGAEGPLSKSKDASFLINYRYSTLSVFKQLNLDFGTGDAIPQYQDLSLKSDFNSGKFGKVSIWGVGGLSYVALLDRDKKSGQDLYGFSARDTYFRSNVGVAGISQVKVFNNNSYIRTNVGISGNSNRIMADRIDTAFKTSNHVKPEYRQTAQNIRFSLNSTYNKKFNSRNFTSVGFYSEFFNTLFVDSNDNKFGYNTFVTYRDYKGSTGLLRVFAQWQHKFSDKLVLNSGLSNQFLILNNSNALEPRLGINYFISSKQTLSFGSGLHSQIQTPYIYFASDTVNGKRVETNKQLDFTRALHCILAYDLNLREDYRIKTELYYQYIFNAPVKNQTGYFSVLNLGADFTSPNVNNLVSQGTGFNYGVELTIEKFYSKGYYVLLTSSLFQSMYRGSDHVLRNTAFNGNYVLNFLGGKEFKIGQRHVISLDLRTTYAGGKRYTPINLEASIQAGDVVRDVSRAYELQYSPYFRTDVKPGYRYNQKRLTHEFSIDIQNVSRNLNVFQQSYDIASQKLKTDYQLRFFVLPQYRLMF